MNDEVFDCKVPDITPAKGNGLIYLYMFDNCKQYVGQTINGLNKRHAVHKCGNQFVDHYIRTHVWNLQVIGEYRESELDDMEKHFISLLGTMVPNGLNLDTGGNLHKHYSEESRKKMSENNKRRVYSDKTRHKISESLKGRKMSEKARLTLININKGKPKSAETRRKVSNGVKEYYKTHINPWKGHKHSEESCSKMSVSHRGQIPWNKGKSSWSKGIPHTPEHADAIRQSLLTRNAIRKFFKEMMV